MSIIKELQRRNVFRVAVAYVVIAWLVLQVVDVVLNNIAAPGWVFEVILLMLGVGLPFALIFAWVFELTPEGLKREREVDPSSSITPQTGRKLDRVIIVVLLITLAWFAWDRFQPGKPAPETIATTDIAATSGVTPAEERPVVPVIAVLPFTSVGSDDGGFLAAGLHEDLLARLAKLAAFRVISRTSMREYANTTKNMRQIGEELGANFILEGGVQALGNQVRISAQLIDASTDQNVWAEIYNRELTATNLFNMQADLAVAIANATQTTLNPEDRALVDELPTRNLEAYNAYLRGIQLFRTTKYVGTQKNRDAAAALEEAVELDPDFALAWALLATARIRSECCEYGQEQSDSALFALDRARALQPGLIEAELAWAEYEYRFLKEYGQALATLERLGERIAGNVYALSLKAWLKRRLGEYQAGYGILLAVQRLEPLNPSIYMDLVTFAWLLNDCEAAARHADTLLTLAGEAPESRVTAASFELECRGDAMRAADLVRDIQFQQFGGYDVAFIAAFSAHDLQLALALQENRGAETDDAIWQQLDLAGIHRHLDGNEELTARALARAAELLEIQGKDEASAQRAMFAAQKSVFYSLSHDAEETRHWIGEVKRRYGIESKDDQYEEANLRLNYAWSYTEVGLYDEAVEELRLMLEEPGGHRFPLVDGLSVFDPIRNRPDYLALKERYGNESVQP